MLNCFLFAIAVAVACSYFFFGCTVAVHKEARCPIVPPSFKIVSEECRK
jgi:hypothetical protein